MSDMIKNIPAEFVARWKTGTLELTPTESLMRFVFTHDIEFLPNQENTNFTAIVRPKEPIERWSFRHLFRLGRS